MNRRIVLLLFIAGGLAAAPLVRGQVYTGAVLYAGGTFSPSPPPEAAFGGQTVGEMQNTNTNSTNAGLWTASGNSVDLDPTDFSIGYGTDGLQQVGIGGPNGNAMLWSGDAASAVQLNPSDFADSVARGVSGNQEVGGGAAFSSLSFTHALLWTGTAASVVDLNPTNLGITNSTAYATNGSQQAGSGYGSGTGNGNHALLWAGTAASAVDLNPINLTGYSSSVAYGLSGSQEVGDGAGTATGSNAHAMLWNGNANSAVDLNPGGITQSYAYATNGSVQVGYGTGANGYEALLWNGTADSAVNLTLLLPSGSATYRSQASSVDALGDVFGTTLGTYNGLVGYFAVEWFQSAAWSAPVSGDWLSGSNWSSQVVPTASTGATFNTGAVTPYTVTLAGNSPVNVLNVQGDDVTIQKVGFNLNVTGAAIIDGTATQQAKLTLAGSGISTFGSLNINKGELDITDNRVVINYGVGYPSAAGAVGAYLATGFNGGAWNGVGIVSSKVASVNAAHGNSHYFGVGYADASDPAVAADHFTPGTVVIEPAIVGDANLDGVVNFSDFLLLASSFNQPNTSWDQGNFNYGTKTNFGDFLLLAANFNNSTSLDNAELDAMNQFAQTTGHTLVPNPDGNGFTVVPEPASLGLLGISTVALLGRRRRRGQT